ncbi:MAG: phage terminase large subunit [Ignavibacteria bacterium]|nr:phage terminase large subunit [Ignavibacteria bacterium]
MATLIDFRTFVAVWNRAQGYKHILPSLHDEIAQWLEGTEGHHHRLLMAYRYSGKSYLKDLYIAWRLYRDPNSTHILISATERLTSQASANIKRVLEHHPLTAHLIPDKNSGSWQNTKFTVLRPQQRREPSIEITSLTAQVTGLHADLVIADDIETHNNSSTQEGRDKIRRAAHELMSVTDNILYIGTPHDEDSIYQTLEYKWNYLTEKFPVIKSDGTPQCPELHDEAWIAKKKLGGAEDFGTHNWWQSQYMLIPVRSTEGHLNWEAVKFLKDEITTSPLRGYRGTTEEQIEGKTIRAKKAYWDPATGKQNRDQSIIVFCAKTYDNEILVMDAKELPPVSDERGMDDQFDAVLAFMQKHKLKQIVVEKNFSFTLASELRKRAQSKGVTIQISESTRNNTQGKAPYIIQSIEPLVNVGKFYVHTDVLTNTSFKRQFMDFPNTKHDDVLDATAGCINALSKVKGVGASTSQSYGTVNVYQPSFRI